MCTGGSPVSMLSGASRGEQKGSLTTGELSTLISLSCWVRRGSKPRGNSSSAPSSLAGAAMATADTSMDGELLEKTVTPSRYDTQGWLDELPQDRLIMRLRMTQHEIDLCWLLFSRRPLKKPGTIGRPPPGLLLQINPVHLLMGGGGFNGNL